MKLNKNQDTQWTWLLVVRGPKRQRTKPQGPRQKMENLDGKTHQLNREGNNVKDPHAEGSK
jgi:hypothetical protein